MKGTDIVKPPKMVHILARFKLIRKQTELICKPLKIEDYVVQPIEDVSPPKWHLGHTTWFFEELILAKTPSYKKYHKDYTYVFNSYYETVGAKVIRVNRGNLTRPSVQDVYNYRAYVDKHMEAFLNETVDNQTLDVIEIGLNHEQQHQELLLTDLKYILGYNPLFPLYGNMEEHLIEIFPQKYTSFEEGVYTIGHQSSTFCYDNELGVHKTYIQPFSISNKLITNQEWIEFINDGGYKNFNHWHAEGWDWVKRENIFAPMYWYFIDDQWHHYTLQGLKAINPSEVLTHISFYEAFAYANWKEMRLPTEFEWEIASNHFNWGNRWEWTQSPYTPYPGFKKVAGALGEYNGKFMINQMVLRGASIATPKGHSRNTYRNFFHPHLRWQYNGLRLVK